MRPVLEATIAKSRTRRPRYDGRAATIKQFERLPDDGFRYELHEGILRVSPSPATPHERIVSFVHGELFAFLKRHPLGEVFASDYDVELSAKCVYRPDVKFVAQANARVIQAKRLVGPPDLVVEVVSPNDYDRDWRVKFNAYEKAGVREYWLIDSESLAATFYVHEGKRFVKQEPRGTRFSSTVVKGFRLDLKALTAYVSRPIGGADD